MKTCDACKKKNGPTKSRVVSVIHNHPAAHKAQKKFVAVVKFEHVDRIEEAFLCRSCQRLVLSGMYKGGNWE